MREQRSDQESTLAPEGAAAKRPWHPPDLQEVDVIDTEFGSGFYAPSDTTTYTS